jgi:hypothetical protein
MRVAPTMMQLQFIHEIFSTVIGTYIGDRYMAMMSSDHPTLIMLIA